MVEAMKGAAAALDIPFRRMLAKCFYQKNKQGLWKTNYLPWEDEIRPEGKRDKDTNRQISKTCRSVSLVCCGGHLQSLQVFLLYCKMQKHLKTSDFMHQSRGCENIKLRSKLSPGLFLACWFSIVCCWFDILYLCNPSTLHLHQR